MKDEGHKKISFAIDYEFREFIDIGDDRNVMIMEHKKTRQVRFVLLTSDSKSNQIANAMRQNQSNPAERKGPKQRICYELLGIC